MIATRFEWRFETAKDRLAIMTNLRSLAMHNGGSAHDLAAKSLANSLMAQANTQYRNAAAKMRYQLEGYSRIGRTTRSRRDQNATRGICFNLTECNFIIPPHDHVLAKLAQVLDQVVSKRIVV